jgi:hypothetical protein
MLLDLLGHLGGDGVGCCGGDDMVVSIFLPQRFKFVRADMLFWSIFSKTCYISGLLKHVYTSMPFLRIIPGHMSDRTGPGQIPIIPIGPSGGLGPGCPWPGMLRIVSNDQEQDL